MRLFKFEPAFPPPAPDARLCPACEGRAMLLPTFSANYFERCSRCNGVGWLKPLIPSERSAS